MQHRVEAPLEPEGADRGAVVQLDSHVHADVSKLPLDRLRDALADGESCLRHQRERQRTAVALTNAARSRFPACFIEQRARLCRIERVRHDLVRVCP